VVAEAVLAASLPHTEQNGLALERAGRITGHARVLRRGHGTAHLGRH